MRIGLVSATYDPDVINGALRMVALYKRHLDALGHEVIVFALGETEEIDLEAGIVRSPGIPLGDHGYYLGMSYRREARKLLSQMEVLHCHHLFMSVDIAHRYGRCPIVYTNHTRYDLYTGAYTPLPQPAADALMRQLWPEFTDLADIVVAPSESVRRIMHDFGVRCPTVVIENGVELEPFQNPARPYEKSALGVSPDAPLLMYVGRLSSEKNLLLLLEQFAAARQILPELRLILIGKGPQEAELQQAAGDLGQSDAVRFLGPVSYQDVPNYLAAADVFVTASQTEVHPLTVIEAMAAGKPIIGVASPGIVDTVEQGETGYLSDHPERGELAAAMVLLGNDPERRQRMGDNARRASRRFDIRRTVSLTLDLYQELLQTRPDLRRKKPHGRWAGQAEKWAPLVDQLAHLIRAPERPEQATGRRLDSGEDGKRRKNGE